MKFARFGHTEEGTPCRRETSAGSALFDEKPFRHTSLAIPLICSQAPETEMILEGTKLGLG
jgi:hypothetical protein